MAEGREMNQQTRLNKMSQHILHSFKIQDLMERTRCQAHKRECHKDANASSYRTTHVKNMESFVDYRLTLQKERNWCIGTRTLCSNKYIGKETLVCLMHSISFTFSHLNISVCLSSMKLEYIVESFPDFIIIIQKFQVDVQLYSLPINRTKCSLTFYTIRLLLIHRVGQLLQTVVLGIVFILRLICFFFFFHLHSKRLGFALSSIVFIFILFIQIRPLFFVFILCIVTVVVVVVVVIFLSHHLSNFFFVT